MKVLTPMLILVTAASGESDPGFLRGMGWSPWHAVHGWGRPPEVVAQDYGILRDLHVNALRTWGPINRTGCDALAEQGLYIVPQIGRGETPRMQFRDGKEGHPVYVAPESRASIAEHARKLATELKDHRAVIAYNLGNEYSWVGQNKEGNYQSLGFDELTLRAFRAKLKERFETLDRWNKLTGRDDTAFDQISPSTGTGKSLLYWEWWRFQREVFGEFLRAGHAAILEVDAQAKTTYALLCGGRWDAATEDADLPFLGIQGDNLYYHWDKDWGRYSVRLARRIGPGRPILVTESGINTWTFREPEVASRLMKQMLWTLALHPEVRGIFPFVYCDEWWHGPDPTKQDTSADAWGIVTANREPKSTYTALRDTYAEFERLHAFMSTREAPVELLVTDQVIDRWRGAAGSSVDDVCRGLYRRGVSFRLVSLLRPSDLSATECKRLVLLDSTIPDEPDGSSPAREALAAFVKRGGQVLYLNSQPWRGLYLPDGPPPGMGARVEEAEGDAWLQVEAFLGKPTVTVESGNGEVFWRRLSGAGRDFLLIVAVSPEAVAPVTIRGATVAGLESADGAALQRQGATWSLDNLGTYALLRLE